MLTSTSLLRAWLRHSLVKTQRKRILLPVRSVSSTVDSEYTPVYNFPFIAPLAYINKAKLYHTLASCISIPGSAALFAADVCSNDVVIATASLGVTGCMLLYTLGYMTANTVGIIYLHKQKENAKISYLDTWGSRRDVVVPLNEIVPFCDQPHSITDPLYLKLVQYTSPTTYKLNVRYGEVLDPVRFEKVFSKVDQKV